MTAAVQARTLVPLCVQMQHADTGESSSWVLPGSPVRVGRNPLNDVVLDDGFVSQWHLVIRFDAVDTWVADVGSTNGTMMNNALLPRNVEVSVGDRAELQLGRIRLRFMRAQLPAEPHMHERTSGVFHLPQQSGAPLPLGSTMFSAVKAASVSGGANPQIIENAFVRLVAFEDAQKANASAARSELEAVLSRIPAPQRGEVFRALTQRMPALLREPSMQEAAMRLGVDAAMNDAVDVHQWLSRLVFGSATPPQGCDLPPAHLLMERLGALLEAFCQAYIDLHSGQAQFASEFGVRPHSDPGGIDDAKDVRSLIRFLLEPAVDARQRIHELSRGFADVALHQLGIVQGVVESTRDLIHSFGIEGEQASNGAIQVRLDAPRWWNFSGVLRTTKRWGRFVERRAELLDRDAFTREIFGRRFVRAYLSVLGRRDATNATTPSAG